jgi:hypothetical protein
MWIHFCNLLHRSWATFMESFGGTTLGFFSPYIIAFMGLFIYVLHIHHKQGWGAVKSHIRPTLTVAFFVAVMSELFGLCSYIFMASR